MSKPEGPTAGPWQFKINKSTKQIQLCGWNHMIVMDFVRWGMHSAQPRVLTRNNLLEPIISCAEPEIGQEHHSSGHQIAKHPDIQLMESAPELLGSVDRLLAIVAFAISKGMPITQEVADTRNAAVELLKRNGR